MRPSTLGILIATFGFMSCSSQKSIESHPPFRVERPVVEYWSGAREEGGTGMRFQARWVPEDPSAIDVDSLFFRGRRLKLEVKDSETGFLLVGNYSQKWPEKPDYVMHADSIREVGNQPPAPLPAAEAFPFDLKEDEAIISYIDRKVGRKYYTRISGVAEEPLRIYPGRRKG